MRNTDYSSPEDPIGIVAFFDEPTFSYSYVVWDRQSRQAAVIDPVLNFDPTSAALETRGADELADFIESRGLQLQRILETHVHADHLSAAQYLKRRCGGRVGIGAGVVCVQQNFRDVFNAGGHFNTDGSQFDDLFADGDTLFLGATQIRVLATPGHTPDSVTYVIQDAAFVGDTLFMPDYGTARADFPGACAAELYRSIQKILALPEDTTLYMCHDYGTAERSEYLCRTSVAEEKRCNVHLSQCRAENEFVRMREARDRKLSAPKLLYPAVQFNMRAGCLPVAEGNGSHYFKIPVQSDCLNPVRRISA